MKQIEQDIDRQLAHVFALHGDEPEQLFYKLRSLIIEWYLKGVSISSNNHRE